MMRFRREGPMALIACAIVVVVTVSIVSNLLFAGMTSSVERDQLVLMRSIIEFNLKGAEGKALSRAELIASLPPVQAAVAAGDREGLNALLAAAWTNQHERHAVASAMFTTPASLSFLRLNAPAKFDEDLTSFRPMVVLVNREHQPAKGFALGRSGPAIFAVAPVADATGAHLGTFEIGVDIGPVLEGIKDAYGLELALFVKEKPLRDVATGLGADVVNDQNRVGEFMRLDATNWDVLQLLVDGDSLSNAGGDYTRVAMDVPYGVVTVPLSNAAGAHMATIVGARDFSGTRAAANRSMAWQGLLALVAIVALAGAANIVVRGMLLRPLGLIAAGFQDLADGKTEPLAIDRDALPEELASLVAAHDALREKK